MSSSYKRINYTLRIAKNIERKMMCEAFRRLSEIRLVETYRYIGFGSLYFSDFVLFHKILNITALHSIEKDESAKKRFVFNRPFGYINLHFGESTKVLPQLDWHGEPSIVWLDYDGQLTQDTLADIQTVCTSASPGSFLIVSFNVHPGVEIDDQHKTRLTRLKEQVGEEKVPADVSEKDLSGWGTAKAIRRVVDNEIQETLTYRNGGLRKGLKMKYRQIFNFHYEDGVKMLTVGGILYDQGQEPKIDSCAFNRLDFIKSAEEAYKIETPYLTNREIRSIDSALCDSDTSDELQKLIEEYGIPENDITIYSKIYRYLPTFAETDF